MSDGGEEQIVHINVPIIQLKLGYSGNNGHEEQELTFHPSVNPQ